MIGRSRPPLEVWVPTRLGMGENATSQCDASIGLVAFGADCCAQLEAPEEEQSHGRP